MMTRAVALLLLGAVTACNGGPVHPAPASPTPVPSAEQPAPPPAPHGFTVSGVVTEMTESGARPVPRATVSAWVQLERSGYHFGHPAADEEGRYRFVALPPGAFIVLYAHKDGLRQPCAATLTLTADTVRDIEVVSQSALAAGNPPAVLTVASPRVSGVVYETTAQGRQPAEGVDLYLEWTFDLVTATSRTDRQGRYLLCGLPRDGGYVAAVKPGYEIAWARVGGDGDTVLDLDLRR
jgi:hypothetical protein